MLLTPFSELPVDKRVVCGVYKQDAAQCKYRNIKHRLTYRGCKVKIFAFEFFLECGDNRHTQHYADDEKPSVSCHILHRNLVCERVSVKSDKVSEERAELA